MSYSSKVLTESYRDKRYEEDLTKLYFDVTAQVAKATYNPTIEYIRSAYSAVRQFSEAVVFSTEHLNRYNKLVVPVLSDMQLVLYGDVRSPLHAKAAIKYNSKIVFRCGKNEIENGINILNELSQVLFLIKQWAYEQGLLLTKPIDRRYGTEAIEDALRG